MFFKTKKLLGLDIGTTSIKLAELDISRSSSTLVGFALAPTPARAIVGGEFADPGAISETVRGLVAQLGTKRTMTAVGMWGSSVITKRISIPRIDEKLVGGQIRWEAEQYIPFDINEVNIDFSVIKGFQSQPDMMDILLVAAKQDSAFLYQDIVQSAGLQCEVIDVCGFALANCFVRAWGAQKGQTVALLNVGAAISNFVIVESGEIVFCRDIPIGGAIYTNEIQKNMGTSAEEAEALKLSACRGQPTPEEVTTVIHSTHEMIADEIQSSIDFFSNTTPGLPIQQCFYSGGGSRTVGLVNYLSQHTKIQMAPFDPFKNVKLSGKSLTPEYLGEIRDFATIAMGLGYRAAGDS